MKNIFARFMKCDSGSTAIEYALIASLIGLSIFTAAGDVGSYLHTPFTQVSTKLNSLAP
jgi:pilus assembly protein Flp/PilA